MKRVWGLFGVAWAYLGFFGLIASAMWRLGRHVMALRDQPFDWVYVLAGGVFLVFMLYAEGWKGFWLQLAPRFASRAEVLLNRPDWIRVLAAPFFCVGFFGARRKRVIASYVLTMGIIGLVLLVRMLDQPWRGIIDMGVVAGLGFGLIGMVWTGLRYLLDPQWKPDPELPLREQGTSQALNPP